MKLEDFADISEVPARWGFVLFYRGEVVYVGSQASRAMLGISIFARRTCRRGCRGSPFDQVLIRAVHPDQIETVSYRFARRAPPTPQPRLRSGLDPDYGATDMNTFRPKTLR